MFLLKGLSKNPLIFILTIGLYGCAEMQSSPTGATAHSSSKMEAVGREASEKCLPGVNEVEVFQVLGSDGALANACDNSSFCTGMIVAVPSDEKGDLWDKKRIKPPKDKCFVANGTYKYTSKNGADRTVPIVAFGYKYLAVDRAEVLRRLDDDYSPLYEKCVNSKEADSETCGCFIELIKKIAMEEFQSGVTKIDQDSFSKKWFNQSKKDCGKSPEKMKWLN